MITPDKMDTTHHEMVAALDFGTTYSGYAYSFKSDFQKDPLKISANTLWSTGNENVSTCATLKTPTTVLFDNENNFYSFGYEAEKKYAELAEEDELEGWSCFKKFKMQLYRDLKPNEDVSARSKRAKKITRNFSLTAENGKKMTALEVFSAAIKYLKEHLLKNVRESVGYTNEQGILWILTVPAIWGDQAKQFMTEAASMAGIREESLKLALEPEAAAIYCKELVIQKPDDFGEDALDVFKPNESFMIIDCGGGTVDITVHTIQEDGSLRELHTPSGGPWGGTLVDEAFYRFLEDMIGKESWRRYTAENPLAFFELTNAFEVKKRNVSNEEKITLTAGVNDMIDTFKEITTEDLSQSVSDRYENSVKIFKKRLRIDPGIMKAFFQSPVNDIVEHVRMLFRSRDIERVKTILMVGGFSESSVVKNRMQEVFNNKRFIIPRDASLAVLNGAVLFGHSPQAITTRLSQYTYGFSTDEPFDGRRHPESHRVMKEDGPYCTDVFHVMVKKNQQLTLGKSYFEKKVCPSRSSDTEAHIEVYMSTADQPMYTTDPSSKRLGNVVVNIPDIRKGKERHIVVCLHFGHTQLYVTAMEEGTRNVTEAKFDCLT